MLIVGHCPITAINSNFGVQQGIFVTRLTQPMGATSGAGIAYPSGAPEFTIIPELVDHMYL
jgi:hypothetical protein